MFLSALQHLQLYIFFSNSIIASLSLPLFLCICWKATEQPHMIDQVCDLCQE